MKVKRRSGAWRKGRGQTPGGGLTPWCAAPLVRARLVPRPMGRIETTAATSTRRNEPPATAQTHHKPSLTWQSFRATVRDDQEKRRFQPKSFKRSSWLGPWHWNCDRRPCGGPLLTVRRGSASPGGPGGNALRREVHPRSNDSATRPWPQTVVCRRPLYLGIPSWCGLPLRFRRGFSGLGLGIDGDYRGSPPTDLRDGRGGRRDKQEIPGKTGFGTR